VLIPRLLPFYSWKLKGKKEPETDAEKLEVTYQDAKTAIDKGYFNNWELPLLWEHQETLGVIRNGKIISARIENNTLKGEFEYDAESDPNADYKDIGDFVDLQLNCKKPIPGTTGLSLSHKLLINPDGSTEFFPEELTICRDGARGPEAKIIDVQASKRLKLKSNEYLRSQPILEDATSTSSPHISSSKMSIAIEDIPKFLAWKNAQTVAASSSSTETTPPPPVAAAPAEVPNTDDLDDDADHDAAAEPEEEKQPAVQTKKTIATLDDFVKMLVDPKDPTGNFLGKNNRAKLAENAIEVLEKLKQTEAEREKLKATTNEMYDHYKQVLKPYLKEEYGEEASSDERIESIMKQYQNQDPTAKMIVTKASARSQQQQPSQKNKRSAASAAAADDPATQQLLRLSKRYLSSGSSPEERISNSRSGLNPQKKAQLAGLDSIKASLRKKDELFKLGTTNFDPFKNRYGNEFAYEELLNNDDIKKTDAYKQMLAAKNHKNGLDCNRWVDNVVEFNPDGSVRNKASFWPIV